MVKNPPADAGASRDMGPTPGSGKSPGRGNGNPLQCSCLENPVHRGAWRAAVHGVAESDTSGQLSSRGGRRTRVFPAALQSLQHCHLPCAWPPGRRSEMSPVPCGMPCDPDSWGLCRGSLGTTLPGLTEYRVLFCPGRGRDFHRQINIASLRSDTMTSFQYTYSGILLKSLHPSQLCRELAL